MGAYTGVGGMILCIMVCLPLRSFTKHTIIIIIIIVIPTSSSVLFLTFSTALLVY